MMKTLYHSLAAACVLCSLTAGCSKTDSANVPADNTKKNERDREATLTPLDQGGSEADRTVTQNIRQAVMKDGDLSVTAKNIKIITIDGVVTLRGPVKTAKERSDVVLLAQKVDGVKRLDDQLEIASN